MRFLLKKELLTFLLKGVVLVGLLVYIQTKIDWDAVKNTNIKLDPVLGLSIFGFIGAQLLLLFYRWQVITTAFEASLTFVQSLNMVWQGLFFNQALPSTMGGDVVRTIMMRRLNISWTSTLAALLAERLTALYTLIMVMAFSPFVFEDLWAAVAETLGLPVFMGINAVLVFGLFLGLLAPKLIVTRWSLNPDMVQRRLLASLQRIILMVSRNNFRILCVVGISVVSHILTIFYLFQWAQMLDIPATLSSLFIALPISVLVTLLPISIGGWGVREVSFISIANLMGISETDAILLGLSMGLLQVAQALPGGLLFLKSKYTRQGIKRRLT